MKLLARVVVVPLALVALVACGGGNRPSEDALAKTLKTDDSFNFLLKNGQAEDVAGDGTSNDGISKKTASCVAEIFRDSKVTDEALTAYVTSGAVDAWSAADVESLKNETAKIGTCKES